MHVSVCACMTLLCDIQINLDATWGQSRLMTVQYSFAFNSLVTESLLYSFHDIDIFCQT